MQQSWQAWGDLMQKTSETTIRLSSTILLHMYNMDWHNICNKKRKLDLASITGNQTTEQVCKGEQLLATGSDISNLTTYLTMVFQLQGYRKQLWTTWGFRKDISSKCPFKKSKRLLERLIDAHAIETFYRTLRFTSKPIRICYCKTVKVRRIHSHPHTVFLSDPYPPIYAQVSQEVSSRKVFQPKCCVHFSSPPCTLHSPPTSLSVN